MPNPKLYLKTKTYEAFVKLCAQKAAAKEKKVNVCVCE